MTVETAVYKEIKLPCILCQEKSIICLGGHRQSDGYICSDCREILLDMINEYRYNGERFERTIRYDG